MNNTTEENSYAYDFETLKAASETADKIANGTAEKCYVVADNWSWRTARLYVAEWAMSLAGELFLYHAARLINNYGTLRCTKMASRCYTAAQRIFEERQRCQGSHIKVARG